MNKAHLQAALACLLSIGVCLPGNAEEPLLALEAIVTGSNTSPEPQVSPDGELFSYTRRIAGETTVLISRVEDLEKPMNRIADSNDCIDKVRWVGAGNWLAFLVRPRCMLPAASC